MTARGTVGLALLVDRLSFAALIAVKAFDSDAIIADIDARGAKVVIAHRPRRSAPRAIDREMTTLR